MLNIFRRQGILKDLNMSERELSHMVRSNPSLKGMLVGYAAEHHFKKHLDKMFILSSKDDDHDRNAKGDRRFHYKGKEFRVEVKSVQSNSVKEKNGVLTGKAQVDASDSREVVLPDGSKLKTTCLLRNEFDVLAVNLYNLTGKWEFAFIKNEEIPSNKYKKYTDYQKKNLLPTSVNVTWPLESPFTGEIEELLT